MLLDENYYKLLATLNPYYCRFIVHIVEVFLYMSSYLQIQVVQRKHRACQSLSNQTSEPLRGPYARIALDLWLVMYVPVTITGIRKIPYLFLITLFVKNRQIKSCVSSPLFRKRFIVKEIFQINKKYRNNKFFVKSKSKSCINDLFL